MHSFTNAALGDEQYSNVKQLYLLSTHRSRRALRSSSDLPTYLSYSSVLFSLALLLDSTAWVLPYRAASETGDCDQTMGRWLSKTGK